MNSPAPTSAVAADLWPASPTRFVVVNGRRVAYDDFSPARPAGVIVLLIGLGCQRQMWYRQLPALRDRYRVLVFDNRDAGESDPAPAPYTIATMATEIAGALRALGLSGVTLMGFSMGGFIAQEIALREPDLVARLILLSTSAGGRTQTPPARLVLLRLVWPIAGRQEHGRRAAAVYGRLMARGAWRPSGRRCWRWGASIPRPRRWRGVNSPPVAATMRRIDWHASPSPRSCCMGATIRWSPILMASRWRRASPAHSSSPWTTPAT